MRLRRDELLTALAVALLLMVLNGLMIVKYDDLLTVVSEDYGKLLSYNFHVSGFDPNTYSILSDWGMKYDVLRHPLLPYLMFPLSQLNAWLTALTGVNCAIYLSAALSVVTGFLTAVCLFRILNRLVALSSIDSALLTWLFFSMAYILVTFFVPDHFGLSLLLILLSVYLVGRAWQRGSVLRTWQTAALFVLTAGVTLTNGVKVFAAEWVARGRSFFRWRFFLLAVLLPSVVIVGAGLIEERVYVYPKQQAERAYYEAHKAEMIAKARKNHQRYKNAPWVIHKGEPLGKGSLLRWTDVSTSRWETLRENVFGESVILHEYHVLDDVLTSYRPVLLAYESWLCYAVEAVVVVLFLVGIVCGWRQRLLWMVLLGIVPDVLMHLVLGFAINEVYIMSAHWLYVVPVAAGFVFVRCRGYGLWAVRLLTAALTVWLFVHNLSLLVQWMQQPIVSTSFWYE